MVEARILRTPRALVGGMGAELSFRANLLLERLFTLQKQPKVHLSSFFSGGRRGGWLASFLSSSYPLNNLSNFSFLKVNTLSIRTSAPGVMKSCLVEPDFRFHKGSPIISYFQALEGLDSLQIRFNKIASMGQ